MNGKNMEFYKDKLENALQTKNRGKQVECLQKLIEGCKRENKFERQQIYQRMLGVCKNVEITETFTGMKKSLIKRDRKIKSNNLGDFQNSAMRRKFQRKMKRKAKGRGQAKKTKKRKRFLPDSRKIKKMLSKIGGCNACGCTTKTMMRCSKCKSVYYCSQMCQRDHWNTHKVMCK